MASPPLYPDNAGYLGPRNPFSDGSDFSVQSFIVNQILGRIATVGLVKIVAASNAGGIVPVGLVDVQPLVSQVDGAGNVTPHGIIHNMPYFRLQGGANAVIIDPVVGDIGAALICSRDISHVKATRAQSSPGSFRHFSWSDGLYLGGFLNGTPTQYIAFSATGIDINTAQKITFTAANAILDASGNLAVTGNVVAGVGGADEVRLQTHRHGTGTNAAGTVAPTPGT